MSHVFIFWMKMRKFVRIDLLKGRGTNKKTTSLLFHWHTCRNMTQLTAALLVLTSIITLTKSSKQRGVPSVTAVCAHEDTSYCAAATQLNFEFWECVAYAWLCACRRGPHVCVVLYSETRRLDLPASRNVNYFGNLQAHLPQSLPSLGMEWLGPFWKPRTRTKPAIQICSEEKGGNETVRTQESRSVFPLENFVPLKHFFFLPFSKTTMANNKGSDVNHHFWVRKQRKLAVRKF